MITKIKNFSQAMRRAVKAKKEEKQVLVSQEEYAQRMGVCKPCSHKRWGQCKECGCLYAVKARLATEDCPLNLWK